MLRNERKIRIYIRNKDRYNIETKKREFLFVEVADFAGTTIGELKENVRRQCHNALKLDALYLNNQPLANDRSVAHYNLEDETVLETTSNPFWVACLYVKAAEITQLQQGHPDDETVQKWTQKSLPKKYTLIGLLLNSKNEYRGQPPYFPTLDDFVLYLEHLNKKGATMHPDYTQKDMRALEREFRANFVGRYDDPLAAFLDHYAVKLGYLDPDEIDPDQRPIQRPLPQAARPGGRGAPGQGQSGPVGGQGRPRPTGRKKEQRPCEDCEETAAVVYCGECPGGLALCQPCSAVLHAGATRRRHTLQDIAEAPKISKSYVPRIFTKLVQLLDIYEKDKTNQASRAQTLMGLSFYLLQAFLAPFAIVVAMYSGLTEGRLSLTETEIKKNAQSLTDTDLQDKQQGKYVGGFDCMENVLMMKGFVQKEAARVPTYALTESGQALGEKLFTFYTAFYKFSQACRLPKVTNSFRSSVIGNRQLCLLIDERERDKDRLLRFAAEKQVSVQVRMLPSGDYVWILTPPMLDPHVVYTGKDYANEQVLPFVVERKSWEDLGNSTQTQRFQRQVNIMLGSGIKNCFYLLEGSVMRTKYNSTHQQQDHLKSVIEKLTTEHGFYVNYTTSWMKSAQWLLWFSGLIIEGLRMGHYHNERISYTEYMSRVARQQGAGLARASYKDAPKLIHRWTAQLFIDHIFRDSLQERDMLSTVQEDLRVSDGNKHLLIIENLLEYNKRRQSVLNKCCDTVHANPGRAREIVEDKIGAVLHNMVHYDIPSYWQLYIQVLLGVYVVRTESDQERDRLQQRFQAGPQDPPPLPPTTKTRNQRTPAVPKRSRKKSSATATAASDLSTDVTHPVADRTVDTVPGTNTTPPSNHDNFRRKAQIHTIDSINISEHLNSTKDDRRSVTHDRHVGSDVSDRDEFVDRKTCEASQTIQPFTGQGFCLGTSTNSEMYNCRDRVSEVGEARLLVEGGARLLGEGGARLLGGSGRGRGGDREAVDDARRGDTCMVEDEMDNTLEAVALEAGDFIDSQNEEDVLNQILNKSAAEVQKTSNEDEMLKLALELSRKQMEVLISMGEEIKHEVHRGSSAIKHMHGPLNTESLDLYKTSSYQVTGDKEKAAKQTDLNDVDGDEEEILKRVIEISKKESTPRKNNANYAGDLENLSEDEQLKLALKMSIAENSMSNASIADKRIDRLEYSKSVTKPVKRKLQDDTSGSSHPVSAIVVEGEEETDSNHEGVKVTNVVEHSKQTVLADENLEEDEELKEALERSVVEHSPHKKPLKSYEKDLRLAIERSILDNISDSGGNETKQETNKMPKVSNKLCTALHSPRKRPRPFTMLEKTVESTDELIKEAIERSKAEHSASKKARMSTKIKDQLTGAATVKCELVPTVCCKIEHDQQIADDSDKKQLDIKAESVSDMKTSSDNDNEGFKLNQNAEEPTKDSYKHQSYTSMNIADEDVDLHHDDDDDDGDDDDDDDIIPPSPEKLSQSLTSSANRRTNISCINSEKVSQSTNKPCEDKNNNTENNDDQQKGKLRRKQQGFDMRSCLFGTSDSSDSGSGGESEEDIFKTLDDNNVKSEFENINNDFSGTEKDKSGIEQEDNITTSLKKNSETNNFEKEAESSKSYDQAERVYDEDNADSVGELEDIGYIDDDANDIDFQPSTQELVDTDEDSDDQREDSDITAELSDTNDELLPLIHGPRSKRYKEMRLKEETFLKQKLCTPKSPEGNTSEEDSGAKNKHTMANGIMYEEDRDLAKCLQEHINRESVLNSQTYVAVEDVQMKEDEEYARRLQAELDHNKNHSEIQLNYNNVMPNIYDQTKDEYLNSDKRDIEDSNEALIRELQRRELEKIRKLKETVEKDENLAKELQTLETGTPGLQKADISPTQLSFKKHVANQKLGKEQTLTQLQEYRKLQMEKFTSSHSPGPVRQPGVGRGAAATTVDLTQPDDWEDQWFTRDNVLNPFSQREAGINQTQSTQGRIATQPDQSQSSAAGHLTQPDQSQSSAAGHLTQTDQSQVSVGSHMTQSGQSQRSNITCGNCGEKGHTRKFVQCPKYHTAEETTRREERAREDKRKREMRAVQEKIKEKINAQKDEKKKQELRNMEAIVMSAETEFQTTMNRLRNIIQEVEHLSGSNTDINSQGAKNSGKKKRKK